MGGVSPEGTRTRRPSICPLDGDAVLLVEIFPASEGGEVLQDLQIIGKLLHLGGVTGDAAFRQEGGGLHMALDIGGGDDQVRLQSQNGLHRGLFDGAHDGGVSRVQPRSFTASSVVPARTPPARSQISAMEEERPTTVLGGAARATVCPVESVRVIGVFAAPVGEGEGVAAGVAEGGGVQPESRSRSARSAGRVLFTEGSS